MEHQNQRPNQQFNPAFSSEPMGQKNKRIKIVLLALAAVLLVAVGGILLWKAQQIPQTPPVSVMEVLTLERCDLDADGDCDTADVTLFQQAIGSRRGESSYNPLADADVDGVVTDIDKQILFSTSSSPDSDLDTST